MFEKSVGTTSIEESQLLSYGKQTPASAMRELHMGLRVSRGGLHVLSLWSSFFLRWISFVPQGTSRCCFAESLMKPDIHRACQSTACHGRQAAKQIQNTRCCPLAHWLTLARQHCWLQANVSR